MFNKLYSSMQVDRLCACVLKLLMFKVCAIVHFSKIEFFNFSGTERVINLFISFLNLFISFIELKNIH